MLAKCVAFAHHPNMLRVFGPDCTSEVVAAGATALPAKAIWIDLYDPTREEEMLAEKLVGTNIPTREELSEIEPSSRLYQKDGIIYLTVSMLHGIVGGHPATDPVGFILTDKYLVSIRYVEPKPFFIFAEHFESDPDLATNSNTVFVRLLDAIVDRLADEYEVAGKEIEIISGHIFNHHGRHQARHPELRLEALLMRIGKAQMLLAKLRETSVSTTRLLAFLSSIEKIEKDIANHRHVDSLIVDTRALSDLSNFLGDNLTFLLDASLGLINLEQNDVMKVFSIFAVVFMPPTLIAGIYGMNFEHMPELQWLFGYPFAMVLIIASAILPFIYARRKGWL